MISISHWGMFPCSRPEYESGVFVDRHYDARYIHNRQDYQVYFNEIPGKTRR